MDIFNLDVNECALGLDDCDEQFSECRNVPGSFICRCKIGFSGDGEWCEGLWHKELSLNCCHLIKCNCLNCW